MVFLGRHQGYLTLRVGSLVLKQVASGDRAIGICNTELVVEGEFMKVFQTYQKEKRVRLLLNFNLPLLKP